MAKASTFWSNRTRPVRHSAVNRTWGMKYSEFGQGDAGRVTLRIQAEAMPKSD